jgi:hypothetical protein
VKVFNFSHCALYGSEPCDPQKRRYFATIQNKGMRRFQGREIEVGANVCLR